MINKQQQILEAAKSLFIEKGFAETSIDDIRLRAGVSKQTIYSYYDGKAALLFGAINQQLNRMSNDDFLAKLSRLQFDTPEQVEASLARFAIDLLDQFMQIDYLKIARVVVAEIVRFPELGRLFRDAVPLHVLHTVEQVLALANQSSVIHIDNPQLAARSFIGTIITYIFIDGVLSGNDAPLRPTEQEIKQVIAFYMPAILA
ncbi:MAG: TetR/AcrR family transcriptional regulator [Sporolactobacillus sp.]